MFVLLRPVGLICNQACRYCYYKAGHTQQVVAGQQEMDISVVDRVLAGLRQISSSHHVICLHGGEPLLVGKQWLWNLVRKVQEYNASADVPGVSIAIQTNATLIDDEIVEIFKRGSFGVCVSLDGPEVVHNSCRLFHDARPTFARVSKSICLMQSNMIDVSALAVLTRSTLSLTPSEFYSFFVNQSIRHMDVTAYVETGTSELEQRARQSYEMKPDEVLEFYKGLFDQWFFDRSARLNIRTFEQTVGALLGFVPTLCNRRGGLACGSTPCVMPDGTVFACDLETEHANLRLGNVLKENFDSITSQKRLATLHELIHFGLRSQGCMRCEALGFCGYACPRYTLAGFEVSHWCNFSQAFLTHVKARLNSLSTRLCGSTINFSSPSTEIQRSYEMPFTKSAKGI